MVQVREQHAAGLFRSQPPPLGTHIGVVVLVVIVVVVVVVVVVVEEVVDVVVVVVLVVEVVDVVVVVATPDGHSPSFRGLVARNSVASLFVILLSDPNWTL